MENKMPRVDTMSNKSSRKQRALGQRAVEKEGFVTEHQTDMELRLLIDEEKYKAVFESAGDIMMLIDKKGRIIDINGKSVEISGYSKEDVLGKPIRVLSKILTKKSLRTVTVNFLKRMVGFNIPPYEIELIKKDGELLTFEVSAQPIKKDGKIIGDLGILRDISARKRAENEIRQHSSDINLINSINEAANEGKDFNEIFQLVSKETQKLFGGFVQIIYLLSEDKQCLEMQNLSLPPGMAHVIEKMIGSRMKGVKIRLKPGSTYAEILNNGKAVLDNDPAMMQNMAKECTEDKNLQALVSSIIKILGVTNGLIIIWSL
jgi:PAS domain S-box-containing protein